MSETRHTGRSAYRSGLAPAAPDGPPQADDYIWPMPTVEEVVARGYVPEYHKHVAEMRAEEVRRFNEDPEYRAELVAMGKWRDRARSP